MATFPRGEKDDRSPRRLRGRECAGETTPHSFPVTAPPQEWRLPRSLNLAGRAERPSRLAPTPSRRHPARRRDATTPRRHDATTPRRHDEWAKLAVFDG